MKLGEALAWLGRGPEAGEVCVDLGASPGGWTYILHRRRAHVVAVDLGSLAPSLRDQKGIEHLRMDAFRFAPELPADWLFCDMAFRPLEVAALLAKWGRKHWARFLVANIKLPMARRAAMLFHTIEFILGFLPVCLGSFYLLGRFGRYRLAMAWLVGASLVFYGWWNPAYLPLLCGSVLVNFALACGMRHSQSPRRWLMARRSWATPAPALPWPIRSCACRWISATTIRPSSMAVTT